MTDLDGATTPPEPGTYPATPGEFAAKWNTWDEDQRTRWLTGMVDAQERSTRCLMANHDQHTQDLERQLAVLHAGLQVRAQTDTITPRLKDNGDINTQHVAIEQTLRSRRDLPSYIAALDGPGRWRPSPPTLGDLDTLAIPEQGPVLFVLHVSRGTPLDVLQAIGEQLGATANAAAPDRGLGILLDDGVRLEALSETDLRGLGLQHVEGVGRG